MSAAAVAANRGQIVPANATQTVPAFRRQYPNEGTIEYWARNARYNIEYRRALAENPPDEISIDRLYTQSEAEQNRLQSDQNPDPNLDVDDLIEGAQEVQIVQEVQEGDDREDEQIRHILDVNPEDDIDEDDREPDDLPTIDINSLNEPSPRRTDVSNARIRDVEKILDTNVSENYSAFLRKDNIRRILNETQLEYLRNNMLLSQYYLTKLEFTYTIDKIDLINELIIVIDDNKDRITDDDRIDINFYNIIINILADVNNDFKMIKNIQTCRTNIRRDIQTKISNEKQILINLINILKTHIDSLIMINATKRKRREKIEKINKLIEEENKEERVAKKDGLTYNRKIERRQKINIPADLLGLNPEEKRRKKYFKKFKLVLQKRLKDLNEISTMQLENLISKNLSLESSRSKRLYLKKVIDSAIILISTVYLSAVIIGVLRNANDTPLKDLVIDDMIDAIEYYRQTLSNINDERFYNISLALQIENYTGIGQRVVADAQIRNYIRETNQHINSQLLTSGRRRREINNARSETWHTLRIITNRVDAYRRRRDRQAELARLQSLRRQERQSARLSDRIRRRTTPTRTRAQANRARAQAQVVTNVPVNIRFEPTDFEKNNELEQQFDTTTLNITSTYPDSRNDTYRYGQFLRNVKERYLSLTYKIKNEPIYKQNLKNIQKAISSRYLRQFSNRERGIPSIKNYLGNSILSLFVRYMKHGSMLFNDTNDYYVIYYNIIDHDANSGNENIDGKDEHRQDGIDAGGLRRDFISSLTSELFEKNIFIGRDGSNKYFLNPNYKPDNDILFMLKKNVRGPSDEILDSWNNDYLENGFMDDFYKFLGLLISFILVNDCGLEKYLSSYIIASFCNTREFDDNDYLSFMIQDFGDEFRTNILMMQDPDSIEYIGTEFNDYYLLDETVPGGNGGAELNKDNIIEYINKTARFMMTKTVLRKDIEITGSFENYKKIIDKGEKITSLVIQGIPSIIRQEFESNNFCPFVINSYINIPKMNLEIIRQLIDRFNIVMDSLPTIDTDFQLQTMKKLFVDYVLENRRGVDEDTYFAFIIKLLRFWTGTSFFKETTRYRIQMASRDVDLNLNTLPVSHTCFFRIDLANYTERNNTRADQQTLTAADLDRIGNKLYDKLKFALDNAEEGMGIAGGSKLRRTSKNLNSTRTRKMRR
jgi:hypothetical protein